MKLIKEELEVLIFEKRISYVEIGKIYKLSPSTIKYHAKKLGIELPTKLSSKRLNNAKSSSTAGICNFCKNICSTKRSKFCSLECFSKMKEKENYDKYVKDIQENRNLSKDSSRRIKSYILIEQNYCCSICNLPSLWNNKELTLILDHIDGNAANNKRDNLRCVCPNCDSQLDTYKSKNKNSARKERYLKNYKNLEKNSEE